METENKPMLSIDGEGNVLKCAKGAAATDCGYKAGAAVCAKCGAAPVEMKMIPISKNKEMMEDEEMPEDETDVNIYLGEGDEEEEEVESPEDMDEMKMAYYKQYGWDGYKKKYGKLPYVPEQMGEEMIEEKGRGENMMRGGGRPQNIMRGGRRGKAMGTMAEMSDEELEAAEYGEEKMYGMNAMPKKKKKGMGMGVPMMEDEEEDEEMMDEEKAMMLEDMRKRRIESMGMKAAEIGKNGYVCAIERKTHPGNAAVCDDCPGGCISEKGFPGLLQIEGLVESQFKGIVIDSGYSAAADMFVVDVQTKDGQVREVFVDGTSAEVVGFHKLDESVFEQKSALSGMTVIGFSDAAEIAIKSIEGQVIAVEPDVFEGVDSYAVEIDGIDGKSYDVFVSLDGEVLGYDKYESEEAQEIEAEAAEIALKRAFSDDKRMSLAKEGMALPDGSYPITSEEDLRNAVQSYGRAKDKEAARLHIMKRAKDLGKENLIPPNWVMGGDMSKKSGNVDETFIASLVEFELLQSDIDTN
jgi:uncharacterized membrane protein YkoI